ncbi:beta-N-acetylglucosaminidase [Paucihalobacter ruber]|uniref:beta-N-acetylhexosaminidase n=1 Tax=Paucihalobacter ruber TaxID=2567861 RepID=A0A506PIR0_9FLAO|nr:glycoside hydrolase family 3 N-terminal domain-containing protein [Paucihalobacter ruber]TPV33464.1 beta-N-acetylglucosaminidase [Paucihalobacter ruber]
MYPKTILYFLILLFVTGSLAQENPLKSKDVEAQKIWVDSIYNNMTLEEKIGQLFMVQVFSDKGVAHKNEILQLVKEQHIGGVIFSKGGPVRQAKLNNELQKASKIPLLVGMDAEWGLSMRLDSTYAFPWNMTLGAIKNDALIEQTGKHIGEHCKRLGVHFNFAPVVDINTNPINPIIGNRSFGEDRDRITRQSLAFMKGMQGAGVLANAKHFPGHGDTDSDSHKTLPTISFSAQRIDSVELYPYRELIKKGLSSVMVAHLNVPALESRAGYPSSISKHIVTNILKDSLCFEGLIFTDALNMKGASNFSTPGDIDLAAFLAGNDVLLISENVKLAVAKISQALNNGLFDEIRLEHSVKKILMAKYKLGLHSYQPVKIENLIKDLNRLEDDLLYEKLTENAITVVKNAQQILPIKQLETKKIAYVKMGNADGSYFLNQLKKYAKVDEVKADKLDELLNKLKNYNTVVVGLHKSSDNPWRSYKFSDRELVWLYEIARTNNVILNIFANPYSLLDLKTHENIESIVVSYQNGKVEQEKSAQLIFGAIDAKGTLPVSAGSYFNAGNGIQLKALNNLSYGLPESVGMNSQLLAKIDATAQRAVDQKMTPGIQLVIARKGKVFYNKTFGYHTYDKKRPVKDTDLFDIASITKIVATTPLIMELHEQGVINLDTKLQEILPEYKGSNKANITLKNMLSHFAQLKPWIPFYTATLDANKKPSSKYYRKIKDENFNVFVAPDLYMRSDYLDSINNTIKDSDLLGRLQYRYSDLPYFILKKYLEYHYNQSLAELVQNHFYQPLGANYTTYHPLEKFDLTEILPTEEDDYFRYQTVHGHVHDMAAAMQNGVGGHAGVFSNANDIAKIMQMFLQKGSYGDRQYFNEYTFEEFNKCHFCINNNRRGVGFDKPQLGDVGPTCGCLSMTSFGHSGFTGTYAWADPEEDIVYVFLANRTYPKATTNLLLKESIRTDIQQYIYDAIIKD